MCAEDVRGTENILFKFQLKNRSESIIRADEIKQDVRESTAFKWLRFESGCEVLRYTSELHKEAELFTKLHEYRFHQDEVRGIAVG